MRSLNFGPKKPPLNSEFVPEVGVQWIQSCSSETVLIKTYTFYTPNTCYFPDSIPEPYEKCARAYLGTSFQLGFKI